jgi:hypothetical protein
MTFPSSRSSVQRPARRWMAAGQLSLEPAPALVTRFNKSPVWTGRRTVRPEW